MRKHQLDPPNTLHKYWFKHKNIEHYFCTSCYMFLFYCLVCFCFFLYILLLILCVFTAYCCTTSCPSWGQINSIWLDVAIMVHTIRLCCFKFHHSFILVIKISLHQFIPLLFFSLSSFFANTSLCTVKLLHRFNCSSSVKFKCCAVQHFLQFLTV